MTPLINYRGKAGCQAECCLPEPVSIIGAYTDHAAIDDADNAVDLDCRDHHGRGHGVRPAPELGAIATVQSKESLSSETSYFGSVYYSKIDVLVAGTQAVNPTYQGFVPEQMLVTETIRLHRRSAFSTVHGGVEGISTYSKAHRLRI